MKFLARLNLPGGWRVSFNVGISGIWNAVECICDPDAKECKLSSVKNFSLDPADYHEHVTTTGELLRYVVSAFRTQVAFVGDTRWYRENYALMKLWADLLDHRVNMDSIKFNAGDIEEWDNVNGASDLEVRRFVGNNAPS
jgi:hypothetical protein